MTELLSLAKTLGERLREKGWNMATAESCTGGQVAYVLTSIAGSSLWFDRAFVTYSNHAKQTMLAVPEKTLADHGAVSEATALAMVAGALRFSQAQVGLAITGIAGPEGGSKEKPVGTVWIAWQTQTAKAVARSYLFQGNRLDIRTQATATALKQLLTMV